MQVNSEFRSGRLTAAAAALAVFFAVMSFLPAIVWQLISLAFGGLFMVLLANNLAAGMSKSDKSDLGGYLWISTIAILSVIGTVTWGEIISYAVIAVGIPLLFGITIAINKAPGPVVAPAAATAEETK